MEVGEVFTPQRMVGGVVACPEADAVVVSSQLSYAAHLQQYACLPCIFSAIYLSSSEKVNVQYTFPLSNMANKMKTAKGIMHEISTSVPAAVEMFRPRASYVKF